MIEGQNKQETLKDIFEKHGERLYKNAFFLLGNQHDAEDLCQDVFLEVFKSMDSFKGRSSIYTWIYKIMLNCYNMKLRDKYKTMQVIEKNWHDPNPHAGSIDAQLQRKESKEAVRNAINKLLHPYKSVIVLRYLEEMPYEEMASVLDCPVGTVRSRLFTAKEKLKKMLGFYK